MLDKLGGEKYSDQEWDKKILDSAANAPFKMMATAFGMNGTFRRLHDLELSSKLKKLSTLFCDEGVSKSCDLSDPDLIKDIAKLSKFFSTMEGSMLDVQNLGLSDSEDITRFLFVHGADLETPEDESRLLLFFSKAKSFFNKYLGEDLNPYLKENTEKDDIFKVFKTAAGFELPEGEDRKSLVKQACALLRIVAILDYIDRDSVLQVLDEAIKELKIRFSTVISKVEGDDKAEIDSVLRFSPGDNQLPIFLENFSLRQKEEDRMIMKLAHKSYNRAGQVFDHVGARITTASPLQALKVLYYMFFHPKTMIFPSTGIRVNRTKQALFGADQLLDALSNPEKARKLFESISINTIDHQELTNVILDNGGEVDAANLFSLPRYRAMHITVDLPITLEDGTRRLCPVEIQFVDKESSITNFKGEASHDEYVGRQIGEVRRRILGSNLGVPTFDWIGKSKRPFKLPPPSGDGSFDEVDQVVIDESIQTGKLCPPGKGIKS